MGVTLYPPGSWSELALPVGLIALAGVIAALVLLVPTRRLPSDRRLDGITPHHSTLQKSAAGATTLVRRALDRGGRTRRWAYALDRAGIRRPLPEMVLVVGASAVAALAVGFLIRGAALGVLLAVFVPVSFLLVVMFLSDRRKVQFADQLDDVSQLLATNLRAGQSLVQGLGALAVDMDEPARSELARTVNQVRVGRDLGDALGETAERMGSDDFAWIAQAIAIHRQVGGNLSDVLDTVGETIRERNQIRRQVKALSAEGRMSAAVLMLLPIVVGIILSLLNPLYLTTFTQSVLGWSMLTAVGFLLLIGGLWLRNLVRVEF